MLSRLEYCLASTLGFMVLLSVGCDSGFGQPCVIPKTEVFRKACSTVDNEEIADENEIMMESRASCAVRNFAGCATRICLVYKGSDAFCTETCASDNDCPGSATCLPIIGDSDQASEPCAPTEGYTPECYCVRKGDLE